MSSPVASLPLHEVAHVTLSPSTAQSGGATLVQSAWAGAATSPVTVTLGVSNPGGPHPGSTTAGNMLVVYVGAFQGTTNPTVSGITLGGAAGNFGLAEGQDGTANIPDAEIWVDWNIAGGQTAVVVSFNAGSGASEALVVYVEEYSGVLSASTPVDKVAGSFAISAAPNSGTLATLSQNAELLLGCIVAGATITGPASPWVNGSVVSQGVIFLVAGHQQVNATTGQAYSGTLASTGWAAAIVSVKTTAIIPATPGGSGTARISPGQPGAPGSGVGASRNSGLQWDVSGIAVSVATNVKEATASAYISYGIQSNTPDDFQGQTQTGSTGDTCTANATIRPGDWITVVWSGGDAGAIATARIFGTVTPPGVS